MTIVIDVEQLEFHDSSIDGIERRADVVILTLENVAYPPFRPAWATEFDTPQLNLTLHISGFATIRQDDRLIEVPEMLGRDASIFHTELSATRFFVALTWYQVVKPRSDATGDGFGSLEFLGDQLTITCGPYTVPMPE